MKSQHLKTLIILFFVFSLNFSFAQDKNMKPRWICPHMRINDGPNYSSSRLSIANYSMKTVKIKLHFYDNDGKMVLTLKGEIPPKGSYFRELDHAYFTAYNREFYGHVTIHADSPAIYPTASYSEYIGTRRSQSGDQYFLTNSIMIQCHKL